MRRDHSGDNGGYLTQHNTKVAPAPATPRQHRLRSPAALICIVIAARHFPTRKTAQSRYLDEGVLRRKGILSRDRNLMLFLHFVTTVNLFSVQMIVIVSAADTRQFLLSPFSLSALRVDNKREFGPEEEKKKGWMVNGHSYSQLNELLKTFSPTVIRTLAWTEEQLDLCAEPFNFYFSLKQMCQRVGQQVYLIKWLGHLAY